jgi:predicted lipoprotein with Yx(FWY)xxD motif
MASGVASTLLLAACGSSTDNSANTGAAVAPGATAPVETTTPADAGTSDSGASMVSTNMVMAKEMSGMGTVVTDAKGFTLYRYAKDQVNMSMCTGSCAQTWMPVMADGTPQAMGLTAKIGTVTRDDGMKQITLAGWPLYRYMGDTKAGDMNGQGKNGTWNAVTPAGKMMAMSSGTSSSSGTKSGSSGTGSGSGGSSMSGMPGM